ncbi:MAG: hypothetical protein A2W52_03345 [Candidatus Taylorbacteria bacterium RIFCSPHIGHO2_02_49_25]|uniref:Uncharacterized protein n=1 Tax=Candidatus Taylorbacteria bacterium RIFCSPHIGHO2_02_49_25 TaxID=1802305 RepID=A0A1G2MDC7_9BACT|nr:MAG: hypothetical protein UY62_C0034G0008 [Parcubacteria group bacterium GW2011_GWF2_50_9]OHA20437.1 MAG: hypothetical protein A2759_02115 [Candidatus Taylorbacteria bacterium RIFCSPHIGHO2_01_FULL_49_60]OHA21910.1 MAG: hypothetical protein A2W52_03345 [Candidatus Taylorbacteria bacterium RIFCSPHIGHO2_02_49_25]OHA36642.1 MAG: hypothetical protein A2W65_00965 [Candidatus Taylorbacteria bacterium RIFCSPLOWO2_02_50_13]OHA45756.1 MAG: hypothetical protein A3G61_03070 [Candidatus Taylorbacteria ba
MHYSPTQYAEALLDLAKESAPSKRHEMVRDFLSAMERNNALNLLPEVIQEFNRILDVREKIHAVSLWSAQHLSEAGIVRKLPFRSRIESIRDVRLGGGVIAEVDGLRVDNSIFGRLARVRQALR